jgi:hypothetical protein
LFIPSEVIMAVNVLRRGLPHVQWSAVFAGAAVALATHVCLGLFGAALGYGAEARDSRALGGLAILWSIATAFTASMVGAVVATRLADLDDDGGALVHGALVWCIGLIAGAVFLTGTLTGSSVGAAFAWSGGIAPVTPDTGAGTALESAAGSAANASLLAGIASLFGLGGALVGVLIGRQLAVVDARADAPRPARAVTREEQRSAPAHVSTLMPPPAAERRTREETIWSDPAFDRRRGAVEDRRQPRH